MKVYTYKGCDTCRRATRWLAARGVEFEELPIRDTPPTKAELRAVLASYHGELRRLFNTSGRDYREMGLKDKLPDMSDDEAIALLAANGNLVKRPFVVMPEGGLVGFNETEWERRF